MELLNNLDVQGFMLIAFGLGLFTERFLRINKEQLGKLKLPI